MPVPRRPPGILALAPLSFMLINKNFLFFFQLSFPIPQSYCHIFHHIFKGNVALVQKSSWFLLTLLLVS